MEKVEREDGHINPYLTNGDINVQKVSGVATATLSLSTMAKHLLNLRAIYSPRIWIMTLVGFSLKKIGI